MEVTQAPAGMESGSKPPAPGALALVQAFLNSVDFEEGREQLSNRERLRNWFGHRGLLEPHTSVSEAEFRRVVAVREALRGLLVGNTEPRPDAKAVDTLNAAARKARLLVRFRGDGRSELEPDATGVDGALGRLLAVVFGAMVDGSWERLKVCRNDACRWAFYDASKNRSAAWCTMADCGNDAKVRAYRQRKRTASRRTS